MLFSGQRFLYLTANSARLRGPEFTVEKPPGQLRVLILGDALAKGWMAYQARVLSCSFSDRSVPVSEGRTKARAVRCWAFLGLVGILVLSCIVPVNTPRPIVWLAEAVEAVWVGTVPVEDDSSRLAPLSSANRQRRRLAGPPVVLVRNGRPQATIIVKRGVDETLVDDRAAANLLQEWIERITGARVPISSGSRGSGGGVPIYVGRAALAAGLQVENVESASREGLRIRVEGDRVMLSGQSGNATMKAAAVFLEELGCRWYIEGDLGREYPEVETLKVAPVELTDRPGFLYRRIWSGDGWASTTPWKVWNGSGGIPFRMRHDWGYIRPEDFAAQPDWFAMNAAGERVRGRWLNTGNPELRRVFAERLIDSLKPGEHASISPPDRYEFDHSPASMRYDDPRLVEPATGNVSMSNRFMHFANEVARRVKQAHPESILGFYAYSDYSQPPTLIDELEPNLAIWIAPFRYSRFHRLGAPNSPSRQQLLTVIDGWRRVADRLGYRTYNYNLSESMTPFSKLTTWTHDIPYLARRDFVGMSIESFPTWDLSAPTIYLSLRLAYAPLSDAEAILEDFYVGFYGPAAAPMRRYWETVDHGWQSLETESGSIYSVHLVFTPERMRSLDGALTRAEQAVAGDPLRRARVAMARTGYLHAADFLRVRDAMHAGRIDEAAEVYRRWEKRIEESIAAGTGHTYNAIYLRRFIGDTIEAAQAALQAQDSGTRRNSEVLPDEMLLAYESDLSEVGAKSEPLAPKVTGSPWHVVRTFGATLDQQGLSDRLELMWYRTTVDVEALAGRRHYLHFTPVDGTLAIWINGEAVTGVESQPTGPFPEIFPAWQSFTVDVTPWLRRGQNRIALRVDHRTLYEIGLGGIVGPVYLLEEDAG